LPLRRYLFKILLLVTIIIAAFSTQQIFAQITVKGTVYNINRTRPLEAVSVISTSGRGTITDSNGNYTIVVNEKDSISFSYLGKATMKYPVVNVENYPSFDIALHVDPIDLRPVRILPRNYHLDSLQNRKDYAKVFDFEKPRIRITDGTQGLGAGFDLDEIIHMFQFNKNRRMLAFQKRLVLEEQDKFVDHRFTSYLAKKITHLISPELDSFMVKYRPSYYFTKTSSDYDFEEYIKLAGKDFVNKNKRNIPAGDMRKENSQQTLQQ
jgi:cell division protein FtsI/penicillin-binding protein 2